MSQAGDGHRLFLLRIAGFACVRLIRPPLSSLSMAASPPTATRVWLFLLLCALALFVWSTAQRHARAKFVTDTDAEERVVDPTSPTGFAQEKRWFIAGERNNRSYQWLEETEQMFSKGEWRVRRVSQENAPAGRPVLNGSPYRWWLGSLAKGAQLCTGLPIGVCIERVACLSDPLLLIGALCLTSFFVWRHWGGRAAGGFSVLATTIYPFSGGFIPSAPDDHGLSWLLGLWTLLPIFATAYSNKNYTSKNRGRNETLLLVLSAAAGAAGLWVNAIEQSFFLIAVFIGALLAEVFTDEKQARTAVFPHGDAPDLYSPISWRIWSLTGAATAFALYLLEYFPAHLDLQPLVNHPLYALGWLGFGEALTTVQNRTPEFRDQRKWVRLLHILAAVVLIAALPTVLFLKAGTSFFRADEYAVRLSFLPNSPVGPNLFRWIARDGFGRASLATLTPLILVIFGVGFALSRKPISRARRFALIFAASAAVLLVGHACFQLREWAAADAAILALTPLLFFERRGQVRTSTWGPITGAATVSVFGLLMLWEKPFRAEAAAFTPLEVQSLIERQLAHWLSDHASARQPIVLLPPDRTTAWCFHGNLRGLGTANLENSDGVATTVRIAAATSAEEAQGLIAERGVNYLILPSWDTDLDTFARWSRRNPEDAFVMALHHWALPPWLQALPYRMPQIPGFESESVVILKVTEETNRVAGLARLAEFFIETEKLNEAASISELLRKFPTDLNALIALATIEKAAGSTDELGRTIEAIVSSLGAGADRSLGWDRRLSLAVVLAQAGQSELAKQQFVRCLERVNETRIRSLTTASLYRLLALSKVFDTPIADQKIKILAVSLLPKQLRERL